jgi:hypothetical protein
MIASVLRQKNGRVLWVLSYRKGVNLHKHNWFWPIIGCIVKTYGSPELIIRAGAGRRLSSSDFISKHFDFKTFYLENEFSSPTYNHTQYSHRPRSLPKAFAVSLNVQTDVKHVAIASWMQTSPNTFARKCRFRNQNISIAQSRFWKFL